MNGYFLTGIIACAVGLAVGACATHAVDASHYGAQISAGHIALVGEQLAHTTDLKAISDKAAKDSFAALARQQDLQWQIADIDAAHQKEIQDEKAKNAKLATDVATGAVRLRVAVAAARRATSVGSVSATACTAGVADGATLELATSARQAYFEVAGGIAEDQSKIVGLQTYIRNVCLKAPTVIQNGAVSD